MFQEKPKTGKKMQEDSRFLFRTSVIIKPSDVSANELINYPKISSIMENFAPNLITKDPKNADEVAKLLESALKTANSDLNQAKV